MSGDSNPSNTVLGCLRSLDGSGVVRIEHRYNTTASELWSALTDRDRLASWYGQIDGDLRPGGQFRLHIESDGWYGIGQVHACEAPRRLLVTTRETDESWHAGQGAAPFDDSIEVVLTPDGSQTILVVEIGGLPLDKIAFYGAGWQIHAESLAAHLAGTERGDTAARWDALVPGYQELASAINTE